MASINWFDTLTDLVFRQTKKIANEVNLKFRFYSEKTELFAIKFAL